MSGQNGSNINEGASRASEHTVEIKSSCTQELKEPPRAQAKAELHPPKKAPESKARKCSKRFARKKKVKEILPPIEGGTKVPFYYKVFLPSSDFTHLLPLIFFCHFTSIFV